MKSRFIFVFLLLAGITFSINSIKVVAQPTLERITTHERSDGKGYVIRYHLSALADSFRVVQPEPELIQLIIYADGIDTLEQQSNRVSGPLSEVSIHTFGSAIGIDHYLNAGNYFRANVYPDQNGRHLLLALERAPYSEIEQFTGSIEPLAWAQLFPLEEDEISDEDNSFLRLRDSMDFSVIVLDAGHGGKDPGTENRGMRLMEKDIALEVTLRVGAYIEEHLPDVKVVYTRTEDVFVPLSERGLIATRNKADLFVSIHVNAAENSTTAHGTETFFLGLARSASALEVMKRENSVVDLENGSASLDLSEEELLIYELTNSGNMAISERIATMIETQFSERAGRRSRGVKQAGLEALWHASTPAVLVELGFLSNPQEARFLTSDYGQTIMASAIFRAIRDFKLEYERSLRGNGRNRASY